MITTKNNLIMLNSKVIGKLENGTITMTRNKANHLYRLLNAWCINSELLDLEWVYIKIIDNDSKHTYVIDRDDVCDLLQYTNPYIYWNGEKQIAIPLIMCKEMSNGYKTTKYGVTPPMFAKAINTRPEYGNWKERIIVNSDQQEIF